MQKPISGESLLSRKHVSIGRAAELMGVSRKTIYNWIKDREVEWFRTPGNRIRIFVDSLAKFDEDDEIFYR